MKIKTEDFKTLRDAIIPVLTVNSELWSYYKAKGLTKKHFIWDVLWASKLDMVDFYDYLDDNNITTALMKICEPYMID